MTRRRTLQGAGALAASANLACGPKVELYRPDPEARELLRGIDHFVVLTMENRSFDHMLGSLLLEEGRTDIDGLTGDEWNEDLLGNRHYVHHVSRIDSDPVHDHDGIVYTWNGGKNDGFVRKHHASNAASPHEVMGYHTRADLPVMYALADEYTVCDAWFSSVMGATYPNRLFLHCASSNGTPENATAPGLPSLFDRLDAADLSSRYYHANVAFTAQYGRTKDVFDVSQFFADAQAGALPSVCMVDPMITTSEGLGYDDHPPLAFGPGQGFIAAVYDALARSPQWPRTLLVITYDEHGGIYDHVPPPRVVDERPEFRQLGFRVPTLLVGPMVRRGYAYSRVLEHVSVQATINARFELEPLNIRAARANDFAGAIDPELIDSPRDPIALPALD